MRVARTLRRRWVGVVALVAILAVVSGAVLTLVAGARRTAHAPAAYTASVGGDIDGQVQQRSGYPMTERVRKLPGVASAQGFTFVFAEVVDPEHRSADTIVFAGTRPYQARLVAGREANPRDTHEFIADEQFVAAHDAHLGSRYRVVTFSREQAARNEGYDAPPKGPSFDGVLVGIFASAGQASGDLSTAVFPTALLDRDVAPVASFIGVRLAPGVTLSDLRTRLDTLPNGRALSLEPGVVVDADTRDAVDAQARGTGLIALVAGLATLVALGQLLTRHVRDSLADRRSLAALGYTRAQLFGDALGRAAVPAIAGVALGVVVAILASGIFPVGFARVLESAPGISVDVVALVGAGAVLVVALLGWVGVTLLVDRRERTPRAPSRAGESIARRAPSAAAATGARFAFTNHEGSTAGSRGTLVVLGVVVAGVVGASAFAVSVDRLVTDRARFGSNYAFGVGSSSGLSPAQLSALVDNDRDVGSAMLLSEGEARARGTSVPVVGIDPIRGDLAPRRLSGRLPRGDDEIALGRVTARRLGKSVGDEVELRGSAGRGTYRVVGEVVVPTIGGIDGVGEGAVVTGSGFARVDTEPESQLAAVTVRAGVPTEPVRKRMAAKVGGDAGPLEVPSVVLNVARVRRVPTALAALLAALALLTLVHTLIVSIHQRRRDVAVLRALGANRSWVARTVHWHATVLAVLPLVVGVPLGLVAGAAVFRAFVDRMGALPDPAFPLVLVAVVAVGLVVVANLVAMLPAKRARDLSPARLLHDE